MPVPSGGPGNTSLRVRCWELACRNSERRRCRRSFDLHRKGRRAGTLSSSPLQHSDLDHDHAPQAAPAGGSALIARVVGRPFGATSHHAIRLAAGSPGSTIEVPEPKTPRPVPRERGMVKRSEQSASCEPQARRQQLPSRRPSLVRTRRELLGGTASGGALKAASASSNTFVPSRGARKASALTPGSGGMLDEATEAIAPPSTLAPLQFRRLCAALHPPHDTGRLQFRRNRLARS